MQTELVDRARRGDHEAFGVLAGGAVDRLYGIARLILRDTELAEDATQDALVRAWRDLPTLRDVERFDAWLYRLIVRSCADIGRRRRRWRAELTVVSIEPGEPDRAAELADRDQLERGLGRLNDAQRTILILHFYVGLSPSEAADALDIPVGTAKSRLHYAIDALRGGPRGRRALLTRPPTRRAAGMNASADLERRLADYYASEAPQGAPDQVLASVLDTTASTRQRRRLPFGAPWRYQTMNSYANTAIVVVAVIAIGAVGIAVLRPGTSPGVGGQAVTPSPETSPSPSPSATSRPTPSPRPAPPLTQSFTSTLHGITMSYPEGWTAQAATEPWTDQILFFRVPYGDYLYDPIRTDHLFLTTASQPIGDSTPDQWAAEKLNLEECAGSEPITVDGATGLIGADDCNVAAVTTDGRGYLIWLYTSGDEASLSATYDRAWFEDVLATVQLQPEDAVDVAPSASP